MAKLNPNSKAGRIRAAHATLNALLRTPKTREGLVAAAKSRGVTANFVYGFLAQNTRVGLVVELKSTDPLTYQLATHAAAERPHEGSYPGWLEPRALPAHKATRVYLDGVKTTQGEEQHASHHRR